MSITGSMSETLGKKNPFRYRGYYYDTETGMYYLKNRYYDTEIRRFINSDTVVGKIPENSNVFAYCGSNPINRADYNGHFYFAIAGVEIGIEWLGGLLGGIVGSFIVNNPQVQRASRDFANSVSRTVVNGIRSATDYWRKDYQERVDARMKERLKGLDRLKNEEKPKHIHHIVAQKAPMAAPARNILDEVEIKINSADNYVALSPMFHMRLHTRIYYGMVNLEMIDAYYHPLMAETQKGSVINRLGAIRTQLENWDAAW